MTDKKLDRRVRKTRALLLQGLIQLMEEKDIKDISVKELADLADINRGTFYLHYNDVFDMLEKIEEELFLEFNEILNRNLKEDFIVNTPNAILLDLFTFLARNRDLARVMIGPHGDLAFVNHLKSLVRDRLAHLFAASKNNNQYYEYIYAYIVAGCIGVIESWLADSQPCPPEEVAALCSDMIAKGLATLK